MSKMENTFLWGKAKTTPSGDLETRVEHLETKMESVQHDITDIKHGDSERDSRITTLENDLGDLGDQVHNMEGNLKTFVTLNTAQEITGIKTLPNQFLMKLEDGKTISVEARANTLAVNNAALMLYSSGAKVGSDNTFTGENTFNKVPSSAVAPTNENHLTNKKYVDEQITKAQIGSGEVDLSKYVRLDTAWAELCKKPCEWADDLQDQLTSAFDRILENEKSITSIKEEIEKIPSDEPLNYKLSNRHKLRLIANFSSSSVETLYNYRSGSQQYICIKVKGWENYLAKHIEKDDPFKNINRSVYDYSIEYHHDGGYNPLGEEDELNTTYQFLVHYGDLIITIVRHNCTKDYADLLDGYKEQMLICFYKHGKRLTIDDDPNIGTL